LVREGGEVRENEDGQLGQMNVVVRDVRCLFAARKTTMASYLVGGTPRKSKFV
jgi:hypothetical protein